MYLKAQAEALGFEVSNKIPILTKETCWVELSDEEYRPIKEMEAKEYRLREQIKFLQQELDESIKKRFDLTRKIVMSRPMSTIFKELLETKRI